MKKRNELDIYSNLDSLNLFNTRIDSHYEANDAMKMLRDDVLTPGIMIFEDNHYKGMLSRRQLFESMSRPFSLELFYKKPIAFLFDSIDKFKELIFSSDTAIPYATYSALERGENLMFEPIVVNYGNGEYKLLDIPQLLIAQSKIHMMTMNSLKEANDFKTEILAIAAHDLKNPLNTIMGLSELIKVESNYESSVPEYADLIFRSSNNMFNLVQKLLVSTAIESDKITMEYSKVSLSDLITSSIKQNCIAAKEKSQTITYKNNINEDIILELDEMKLTEVIDNLINNAIKYSPYGKGIEIGLYSTLNSIVCYIKDDGPGIKDEDKNQLFGKFQRLSSVPTGGETSSGLGLYIVKKIIELHHGNIWVESEYGHGSKFLFELPYNCDLEKSELISSASFF